MRKYKDLLCSWLEDYHQNIIFKVIYKSNAIPSKHQCHPEKKLEKNPFQYIGKKKMPPNNQSSFEKYRKQEAC